MDLHPLFVHFPIALLTFYTFLEIANFFFWRGSERVRDIKATLVIGGALTTAPTILTGLLAEEGVREGTTTAAIVEVHEAFGILTAAIFLLLAGVYAVYYLHKQKWYERALARVPFLVRVHDMKYALARHMLHGWAAPTIALLGFLSLAVTGALGAAMVHGPTVDPFVELVYTFLVEGK